MTRSEYSASLQGSLFAPNSNAYHNTLPIHGKALETAEAKAQSLEVMILKYFSDHSSQGFTPPEVQLVFGQQWPLTSVRRSITNLTTKGFLITTGERRPGLFGSDNNVWIYSPVTKEKVS